jgi:tetratricopeptide (TPR) repeat protein
MAQEHHSSDTNNSIFSGLYNKEGNREKSIYTHPELLDSYIQANLSKLQVVEGITLLDEDNTPVNSEIFIKLIQSKSLLQLAMNQLESLTPGADVLNNLGCVYAFLGMYKEAKVAFQNAINAPSDSHGAKKAATTNLEILNDLITNP